MYNNKNSCKINPRQLRRLNVEKENVMETLNQQVVKELEQMKLLGFKISKKTILLAAREDLMNMAMLSMSVGEIADYLIEVTSYN